MTAVPAVTATLEQLLAGQDLGEAGAAALMHTLTDAQLSPAVAAALLVALRVKGETADELRGLATAMRALALRFELGHEDVAHVDKMVDIERRVLEPRIGEGPGRPVGRGVRLCEGDAECVFDDGAEADALFAEEA